MPTFDDLIKKIEHLKQICYQNFAPRITNIENYLSTITERVQNGSVIVTGAFTTEKITPLNISETELIEVYNNVPKVLLKNSIIAELTTKSYREDNQNQPILLEKDEYGKYWVIVCDKKNIFLTPSINIKFHIHKLKTVEKIFDFRGVKPLVDTHFLLIKPAKVQSLPNGKEWKLLEKGILEFTNHIFSVSFQSHLDTELQEGHNSEIKKINTQLNYFQLQLEQLREDNTNLKSQLNITEIKDNQANTNVEILKIHKQLQQIKSELEEFDKNHHSLQLQINNLSTVKDGNDFQDIDIIKQQIELFSLVQNYNLKLEFPEKREVTETIESKFNRMNGSEVIPNFEYNNKGVYWIIYHKYLVPKFNLKINSHSYQLILLLFEVRNDNNLISDNFILIKPAQVKMIGNPENWQVTEKGIIEFIDKQQVANNDNQEITNINQELQNLKSILESFGEEQNNLASKIGKITVLRDYVNMHIDLIKVRLESLENKNKNHININSITDSLDD
jgi:prefoldin subunit 5